MQPVNINIPGVLGALNDPNAKSLTNEGMMLYLKTRLEGLDGQIDAVFEKQQKIEKIRDALARFSNELGKLEKTEVNDEPIDVKGGIDDQPMKDILKELDVLDPKLAKEMRAEMEGKDFILHNDGGSNGQYTTRQVENSKQYVSTLLKKLESSSQLEMIGLQSFMSSRQTAIQLATNLVAALGESLKGQVAKIG